MFQTANSQASFYFLKLLFTHMATETYKIDRKKTERSKGKNSCDRKLEGEHLTEKGIEREGHREEAHRTRSRERTKTRDRIRNTDRKKASDGNAGEANRQLLRQTEMEKKKIAVQEMRAIVEGEKQLLKNQTTSGKMYCVFLVPISMHKPRPHIFTLALHLFHHSDVAAFIRPDGTGQSKDEKGVSPCALQSRQLPR